MQALQPCLALLLLFLLQTYGSGSYQEVTCYYDQEVGCYLKQGKDPSGVAWGTFYDELKQTGWNRLYVESNSQATDEQQMMCAGYIEGSLTAEYIMLWYMSFLSNEFGNQSFSSGLQNYLEKQYNWSRTMADTNRLSDSYWNHIYLIFMQFDGLLQGYNQNTPNSSYVMDTIHMYALNADGDLETLKGLFPNTYPKHDRPAYDFSTNSYKIQVAPDSNYPMLDCSGFIRITPGNEDLLVGHTTWTHFFSMYRIFKNYNFPLSADRTTSIKVSFSSKPGFLCSKDDFYMMDSKLVSLETTNSVLNSSLYSEVTPSTVLTWMRAIVANRMATDGKSWTEVFSKFNSGTYNNQWMVVDYNKFTPGTPILPGTLWVLEQIPGQCESADVSQVFASQSYWSSFNIPFFSNIYNISGYPGGNEENGHGKVYLNDPRRNIFARDYNKVVDLDSMKTMMQYNDWQHDPLSAGDPGKSVSSRYDLEPTKPSSFGGIDSKLSSFGLLSNFSCAAISGPTHQQQSPFIYSWEVWPEFHNGLPEVWDYDWIVVQQIE